MRAEFADRPVGANQPQEKPPFDAHPDRAPEGMAEPPELIRKLEAEMVFLTLRLPHLLQQVSSVAVEEVITSKRLRHSSQRYS